MKRTIPFYTGRNACTDSPCWVCRVATGPGLISTLAAYLHSRIIFSSCLVLACRPSIRHGLENEFKVNIEPNHTTLAGAMSSSKSTNSSFYCQNHLHNDSVPPEKTHFFVESWHLSGTTALKMTPIFLTVFITDRGACFSFPSSWDLIFSGHDYEHDLRMASALGMLGQSLRVCNTRDTCNAWTEGKNLV